MTAAQRPFDPATDYPALAALHNTIRSEPTTAERLRFADAHQPDAALRRRIVALDSAGAVAGVSSLERYGWMRPGTATISVIVLPPSRRQGIGAALYEDAQRAARAHGVGSLAASLRDNDDQALRFAEGCGFCLDGHEFESTLDLTGFDDSPFVAAVKSAEAAGIRFTTMEEVGDSEALRERVYTLHRETAYDNPGFDDAFPHYVDYQRFIFQADWYGPELALLAMEGGRVVGLSLLHLFESTRCMYTEYTGVARAYRGRHLALALKLLGVRAALARGAALMRTDNDSHNVAMLAVNHRLGYQRAPGIFRLRADIA